MGITGLLPFLKKASRPTSVREFKGGTVAVDSYCWLHKGAFSCAEKLAIGEDTLQYVYYCMKYVNTLLGLGIKPIMVFDGCRLPSKADTERARREARDLNRQRAAKAMREGNRAEAVQMMQRCVDITPCMALELMKVCRSRGVDCIVAPYEADAQLAYLARTGIADCIITEDSDLILFGCEKVMFKMDFAGNGILVDQSRLHECMGLRPDVYTFTKFRHMCILSGCDYLPSLPGIGLAKACKLFKLTRQMDIELVLRRMASTLSMSTLEVTPDYIEAFQRADSTFLYQFVYDPLKRQLVPLTPYPPEVDPGDLHYAGPPMSPSKALQIALGNVDVNTGERIYDFNPDTFQCKSAEWDAGTCPPHRRSVWDHAYAVRHPGPLAPAPQHASTLGMVVTVHRKRARAPSQEDDTPSRGDLLSSYTFTPKRHQGEPPEGPHEPPVEPSLHQTPELRSPVEDSKRRQSLVDALFYSDGDKAPVDSLFDEEAAKVEPFDDEVACGSESAPEEDRKPLFLNTLPDIVFHHGKENTSSAANTPPDVDVNVIPPNDAMTLPDDISSRLSDDVTTSREASVESTSHMVPSRNVFAAVGRRAGRFNLDQRRATQVCSRFFKEESPLPRSSFFDKLSSGEPAPDSHMTHEATNPGASGEPATNHWISGESGADRPQTTDTPPWYNTPPTDRVTSGVTSDVRGRMTSPHSGTSSPHQNFRSFRSDSASSSPGARPDTPFRPVKIKESLQAALRKQKHQVKQEMASREKSEEERVPDLPCMPLNAALTSPTLPAQSTLTGAPREAPGQALGSKCAAPAGGHTFTAKDMVDSAEDAPDSVTLRDPDCKPTLSLMSAPITPLPKDTRTTPLPKKNSTSKKHNVRDAGKSASLVDMFSRVPTSADNTLPTSSGHLGSSDGECEVVKPVPPSTPLPSPQPRPSASPPCRQTGLSRKGAGKITSFFSHRQTDTKSKYFSS